MTITPAQEQEIRDYLKPRDGTRSMFEVWVCNALWNTLSALDALRADFAELRRRVSNDVLIESSLELGVEYAALLADAKRMKKALREAVIIKTGQRVTCCACGCIAGKKAGTWRHGGPESHNPVAIDGISGPCPAEALAGASR